VFTIRGHKMKKRVPNFLKRFSVVPLEYSSEKGNRSANMFDGGIIFTMAVRKFWKRVIALLHDNRTVLRKEDNIEDWEEDQRIQREKEAERQKKEQEILTIWFMREEYINAGRFKRFLMRFEFLFRDTRGGGRAPKIPEHIITEVARCLMPDILAFYESEAGKKIFEEWKAKRREEHREDSSKAS